MKTLLVLKIPPGTLPNRANFYLDGNFIHTVRAEKIYLENVIHLGSRPGILEIVLDIFGFTSGPDEILKNFRKGMLIENIRLDIQKERFRKK